MLSWPLPRPASAYHTFFVPNVLSRAAGAAERGSPAERRSQYNVKRPLKRLLQTVPLKLKSTPISIAWQHPHHPVIIVPNITNVEFTMTQWRKILMAILPALLVLFMTMPATIALAADEEGDSHAAETTDESHADDSHGTESSTTMVTDSAVGAAGITLSLLALVLLIVLFVVLLGAIGLGVIGIGYWQSMAD